MQVVWAADDPALGLSSYGELARKAAALTTIETVAGKHFLQEDQAPAIADHVATIANRSDFAPRTTTA